MPQFKPQLRITAMTCYDDLKLSEIVTMSEARLLWGKSRRVLMNAIEKGKISARRSLSGGEYLITHDSMVKVYGMPVTPDLYSLYGDDENDHPLLHAWLSWEYMTKVIEENV